jgi:hypothetical protein
LQQFEIAGLNSKLVEDEGKNERAVAGRIVAERPTAENPVGIVAVEVEGRELEPVGLQGGHRALPWMQVGGTNSTEV